MVNDCPGEHKLWTREGDTFTAHAVQVGISNGINTEILGGISEGTQVVTEATLSNNMPMAGPAPAAGASVAPSCRVLREATRRISRESKYNTLYTSRLQHTYIDANDIRTSTLTMYAHRHHRHTYIDTIDIRMSPP